MKKIMVIVLAMGLALGASAQRFGHGYGGGHVYVAPRVGVGIGISPFYSPWGYYPYGYYPYGYPYGGYARVARPTKLDVDIQDIKNEYSQKIYAAKHDKSLSRADRKATVHQLKVDRDQAINDAKRNYYKY